MQLLDDLGQAGAYTFCSNVVSGLVGGGFQVGDNLLAKNAHLIQCWNNWLSGQGVNVPEAEAGFEDAWAADLYLCGGTDNK